MMGSPGWLLLGEGSTHCHLLGQQAQPGLECCCRILPSPIHLVISRKVAIVVAILWLPQGEG